MGWDDRRTSRRYCTYSSGIWLSGRLVVFVGAGRVAGGAELGQGSGGVACR